MKKGKRSLKRQMHHAVVWPTAILGLGITPHVVAQQPAAQLEEVIVTARRQEENVQEIPIAMTVIDEDALTKNNIASSADLKAVAPSLAVNNRFGPDQAMFAIRGFTQELRTTASVGVYFADVVAPRGGAGSVTTGDGAGPGAFFDLQNVLVLKGPQGTLFGRNTTGGAILLTPKEPTVALEGYLEQSLGSYNLSRTQGAINVPINDKVRTRFSVDKMTRDGYLDNKSGIGPDDFADVDYIAGRASVIVDITDAVQNYTIYSYSNSKNNGTIGGLYACNPARGPQFNFGCVAQLAHQGDDYWAVENSQPDPESRIKQWQLINTTSWFVNDDFTIKNILSYADLETKSRSSIFGINYNYFNQGTYSFTESNHKTGVPTSSQISIVEELQFSGYALDGDLTWQAGLYFEHSKPDGESGTTAASRLYCAVNNPNDPSTSQCVDVTRNMFLNPAAVPPRPTDPIGAAFPLGYGSINSYQGESEFTTEAAYTEMTYDLTDDWKVTGGLRYTHDEAEATTSSQIWSGFPFGTVPNTAVTPGVATSHRCIYSTASLANNCYETVDQTSEAFTGLLDFDYFISGDVMLYAKYSRGYRMGSVNPFGAQQARTYDPEQVDAYEVGAKSKFGGPVPGTFNLSVFYNDLQDQQIQYGFLSGGITSTVIANAGKSVIQGFEADTVLNLLDDLRLSISYAYLDTEAKKMETPGTGLNLPAGSSVVPSVVQGEDLTFSPMHSVTANLNYRLPLPADVGAVSVGTTYSYTSKQNSSSPSQTSPLSVLGSYETFNFDASWVGIFGSGFDAGLFVTNAFNEEYETYVSGQFKNFGFETHQVGAPRMWGGRVRYNF